MTFFLVAVAAACGVVLRVAASARLNRRLPVGTFAVNVAAAFVVGVLAPMASDADVIVRIGLLGALSTWSTLALETTDMMRRNEPAEAVAYLSATLVCGIGAAWLGLQI